MPVKPPIKTRALLTCCLALALIAITHRAQTQTPPYKNIPLPSNIIVSTPAWENWSNADGSGFYFELLHAIYGAKGISLTIDISNFLRSIALVRENRSDITLGILKRTDSEALLITPHYPIDSEEFVVISKNAHAWNNLEELKGHRVIIPRGYLEQKYQTFGFKRIDINDSQQGLKMLLASREKYLILTRSELIAFSKILDIDTEQLQIKTLLMTYTYPGFSDSDKGRTLALIYDQQLPLLIKQGFVKALYEKWQLQPQALLQLPSPWQETLAQ